MRKLLSATIAAATLAGAVVSVPATADVSANVGFVSDYYFRGSNLGDGGAYAGVDYSEGGFYAGTWWIDDGTGSNDGLETDFYLGYGMENEDSVSWNVGYTRYEYTYATNFEHEINLGLAFSAFGLNVDLGEADPNTDGSDTTDYTHVAFSWAGDVFGALVGLVEVDDDFDESDYTYFEVSAGGEVAGLDMGATLGVKSSDGVGAAVQDDGYLFLDISKSFDL